MRRGGPRGRGNRPMHSQRPQQQSQSVPFMSSHLQGLKDIDMELELLKRKREIIEQQQDMLSNSYRPRKDYEQPFNQSRENRYDDYTRLYDDYPRDSYSGGGGGGSSARKRQYVPVWENETPPKRFSAPSRGVQKAFGSRPGPAPNPRSEFHRAPAPRPAASKPRAAPPPKRREFNPTKVTKTSSATPPAKFNYKSPSERKKLVTESLANSSVTLRATPLNKDKCILRADLEPSRQLNGRLEIALGIIMKELRNANPESDKVFTLPVAIRAMKKAVRERIWTVMIGKEVTTTDDIKANYYKTFPSHDDKDLILKGLQAQKGSEFYTVQADHPEEYFKQNIHRLMSLKLEEMARKLEEIYTGKVHKPKRKQKHYQTFFVAEAASTTADAQPKTEDAQPETEDAQPETEDAQPKTEDALPMTEDVPSGTDEPKCENAHQNGTDDVESKPDVAQSQAETTESVEQPDATLKEVDDTKIKTDQAKSTESASGVESSKGAPNEDLLNNKQYQALDKFMNYKMIHLIRKFTPDFLKAMDVDSMYRKAKANILNERKNTLEGADATEQDQQTSQGTPNQKRLGASQYFVKILGKPGLPKRKAMETFFKEFKPKNIKKHKTIHQLLFVGFNDKASFDKILAADGTVIGRYTLSIKISERSDNKGKPNNANDSVGSVENMSQANESGSEIIGTDLDEQITDLLTSIRKGEDLDTSTDDVVDLTDNQNDVKKENGDQEATTEDVTLTDNNEKKVTDNNEANADEDVQIEDNQDGDDVVEVKDSEDDHEVIEIKDVPVAGDEAENGNEEKNDVVEALKAEVKEVKGTPTRASTRLATPGGIRTRRMSKQT